MADGRCGRSGSGRTGAPHCEEGMTVLVQGRIHDDPGGPTAWGTTATAPRSSPGRSTCLKPPEVGRVRAPPSWSTATTRSRSENGVSLSSARRAIRRVRHSRLGNRLSHRVSWRETNTSPFRSSFLPGKDSKNASIASRACTVWSFE